MTGKVNGLGARLRVIKPAIICICCICHKLALLCPDSNKDVSYVNSVMGTLRSLWKYFEDSPKRTAKCIKVTANTKNIDVPENKVKQFVTKLVKAANTRWLSFDGSVRSVHRHLEGIMQTLHHLRHEPEGATAEGQLRRMHTQKLV